jgi:hypothetical protein
MLKTVSSITNAIGALNYKGTWDATTNTPALASGVGTKGDYYVVSVAGTTALDGISNWYVGDWATFNGSVWQRIEGGVDDPAPSLKSNSTTGLMQITGPSAGQTRVVTIPDANATMARTDAAQTFTGTQVLTANTGKGTISGAASGVAQTIFDPTTIGAGVFNVIAYLAGTPANDYAASAIVVSCGIDAKITATNATLMTLTLSGNNVQATQSSGITTNIQYAFFRVGH